MVRKEGFVSDKQRKAFFASRTVRESNYPAAAIIPEINSNPNEINYCKENECLKRKGFSEGSSISEIQAIQAFRSPRSRTVDRKETSKETYSLGDEKGRTRWKKRPYKVDLEGIDTRNDKLCDAEDKVKALKREIAKSRSQIKRRELEQQLAKQEAEVYRLLAEALESEGRTLITHPNWRASAKGSELVEQAKKLLSKSEYRRNEQKNMPEAVPPSSYEIQHEKIKAEKGDFILAEENGIRRIYRIVKMNEKTITVQDPLWQITTKLDKDKIEGGIKKEEVSDQIIFQFNQIFPKMKKQYKKD